MSPVALLGLLVCCATAAPAPRSPAQLPEFVIDLDLPPEQRFVAVIEHFRAPLNKLYSKLVDNFLVKGIAAKLAARRGPENAELMGEVNGIAAQLGWPVSTVHAAQLLYELQTLMVPLTNISLPFLSPHESAALTAAAGSRWGFGCTGIIARSPDGSVIHARNLDFSLPEYLQPMAYNAKFSRSGKYLYTAQMIAAYQAILTGIRPGKNGYSFEVNTRFYGHKGGNALMIKNVFEDKRPTSGWVKRQILQNYSEYEDAVHAMSTMPYAATEYNIISGVRKGTILARDPDRLVYNIDLTPKDRYIIMTNFDYIYHDIKEFFDPTGVKGIGHPRRIGAEKLLNSSDSLSAEVLYSVINNDAVMATDTMFQAIINVEKNLYNTSLPACKKCG